MRTVRHTCGALDPQGDVPAGGRGGPGRWPGVAGACRKHGISDDDIRHAINNAIAAITRPEQPEFTMLFGPTVNARLLEVGIVATDDQDYVIHAMPARDKYLSMIDRTEGDRR